MAGKRILSLCMISAALFAFAAVFYRMGYRDALGSMSHHLKVERLMGMILAYQEQTPPGRYRLHERGR